LGCIAWSSQFDFGNTEIRPARQIWRAGRFLICGGLFAGSKHFLSYRKRLDFRDLLGRIPFSKNNLKD
jgi:hypothetical protein